MGGGERSHFFDRSTEYSEITYILVWLIVGLYQNLIFIYLFKILSVIPVKDIVAGKNPITVRSTSLLQCNTNYCDYGIVYIKRVI